MPDIGINKKPFIARDHPQVYKNLFVEGVLLVVALGLLLNFLVLPKKRAVSEAKSQAQELAEQSSSIDEKTAQMNTLINQMKTAQKDIEVLDSALPLESRVTTTHVLLDGIVAASGLTLASITTETDENLIAAGDKELLANPFAQPRQLQTVSVTMGLTGTMDQFLSFLKAIESSARIIDVSSLEITGNKNDLAAFKLTLKTYFFGTTPKASASPVSAPLE